jgi:hypothetical protein
MSKLAVPIVASLALLAAGCGGGGGGSAGVASVVTTSTTSTTLQVRPIAFPRCMRSNGVPRYPDDGKPTPQQVGVTEARFQAALNACSHLLPNGGDSSPLTAAQQRTRLADELSFARCMRSHGVGRFPDPTAQGELSVERVRAQGIDVHAPAVLRVVMACLPASHGALTPAKVRQALADAGR